MAEFDSTCWTVIQKAARGFQEDREEFARRYAPIVRAYLGARWRGAPCIQELDDAVQEVFLECFRGGGVLERVDPNRAGGFRAFLYGVVRNIALRVESRRARRKEHQPSSQADLDGIEQDEETLSRAFDRAWVSAILREAASLQAERAKTRGEEAGKRVELLRLRFHERLPIREIARLWGTEAELLHREYAKARDEFKRALLEVVAFHHSGTTAEVEGRCEQLISSLG